MDSGRVLGEKKKKKVGHKADRRARAQIFKK